VFEVMTVGSQYKPADVHSTGNFRQDIELSEPPAPDVGDNRFPTVQGEIQTIETDGGRGTPVLHAAVQLVEDAEVGRWEYPVLGTVATIRPVTK